MKLYRASNGTYYARFKQEKTGKLTMRSLETKDEVTAETKFKKYKESNGYLADSSKNITLSGLYSKFFQLYEQSNRDARHELYSLKYLTEHLNDCKVSQITKYQIEMYKIHRSQQKKTVYNTKTKTFKPTDINISPTTVNIEFRVLKSIFNKAIDLNLIDTNPFINIKPLKVTIVKKKTLTDTEMFNVIRSTCNRGNWDVEKKAIVYSENTNMKNMFLFGFLTGCRISEIINLQWSDINYEDGIIDIQSKVSVTNEVLFRTKTNSNREIPLTGEVKTEILGVQVRLQEKWKLEHKIRNFKYVFGYVKDSVERHYSRDYVSHYFKKMLRENDFDEHLSFHKLRHTCCTNLLKKNVSAKKVQNILGHAKIETTMKYAHLDTEDLRSSMELLTVPKG